ncbi:MAG: hypothetical protein ACOCRX_00675 [Candidatus Woesearchaeota archaeon]
MFNSIFDLINHLNDILFFTDYQEIFDTLNWEKEAYAYNKELSCKNEVNKIIRFLKTSLQEEIKFDEDGLTFKTPQGLYVIFVNKNLDDKEKELITIHEVGHIIASIKGDLSRTYVEEEVSANIRGWQVIELFKIKTKITKSDFFINGKRKGLMSYIEDEINCFFTMQKNNNVTYSEDEWLFKQVYNLSDLDLTPEKIRKKINLYIRRRYEKYIEL